MDMRSYFSSSKSSPQSAQRRRTRASASRDPQTWISRAYQMSGPVRLHRARTHVCLWTRWGEEDTEEVVVQWWWW